MKRPVIERASQRRPRDASRCTLAAGLAVPALCGLGTPLAAQTTPVTGPLVQLVQSAPPGTFNQLELLSATANQASYNALVAGINGRQCSPSQTAPTPTCNGNVFFTFNNVRVLVQTANELLNNGGATLFSLHTSLQGLGFALRWTAGENLLAPGSTSTQFASGQMSSVSGRLAALRMGATGFAIGGITQPPGGQPVSVAGLDQAGLGGGASADDIGIASRWGGFFDAPYGWGYRDPSVIADAFAFDSRDFNVGVDYRFTRHVVAGVSAGYTDQRVDFDSLRSTAGGGFRSHGYGLTLYGQWEGEGPYVAGSVGYQRLSFHETRKVTYPSFNIAVPSPDATADGSSTLQNILASVSVGWVFTWGGTSLEPYVRGDYRLGRLGDFTEVSYINKADGTLDTSTQAGYGLSYAAQTFRILDAAAGVRLQQAIPTPIGVILPYARFEYHHNYLENSYAVTASYVDLGAGAPQFNLPADPIDASFYQYSAGVLLVLPHGLQAFAQYQATSSAPYVASRQATVSIRGEF